MDIVQKSSLYHTSSSGSGSEVYVPPAGFYTPYNTPPYIAPSYCQPSWLSESATPSSSSLPISLDDVQQQLQQQMQHVRFPTPPNTPPRADHVAIAAAPTSIPTHSARTQSVIMKVHSPLHASASTLYTLDEGKSCSSSSECGTSSDFLCNWLDCGSIFDSLESLAQHVTQLHAVASMSDGLYYCRWLDCQRSERGFNARYKMLVHVRTHTKEKPHRCHLCEKSFSRAENLKIHIRSHSGEKPYRCTFEGCQKAYSNSSDRFKHTRTHSMEKPYMCKIAGCQKRYTDPSSLRKHVKTFKHSIQMMASQPPLSVSVHQPAFHLDASEPSYTLCLPAVSGEAPARYYLDMSEEMAATDYTLGSKLNADSRYWRAPPHGYLHGDDFAMVDSPLDLRVNRS